MRLQKSLLSASFCFLLFARRAGSGEGCAALIFAIDYADLLAG